MVAQAAGVVTVGQRTHLENFDKIQKTVVKFRTHLTLKDILTECRSECKILNTLLVDTFITKEFESKTENA